MPQKRARASMHFTSKHMQEINSAVSSAPAPTQSAPGGFTAMTGKKVPSSLNLKPLPQSATSKVPSVKGMDDAKLDNKDILIVDPSTNKIQDYWKAW